MVRQERKPEFRADTAREAREQTTMEAREERPVTVGARRVPSLAAFSARRLFLLFSVLGPGIIAANADNDASGIFGYSLAGSVYQYKMLWVLVLSTFALGVAQEMGARMAAV